MIELSAHAALEGLRIDLSLSFPEGGARSDVKVLRRQLAHPENDADGLVVLDQSEMFASRGVPWGRVERTRYVAVNSAAEGGLVLAEIVRYFADANGPVTDERTSPPGASLGVAGYDRADRWITIASIEASTEDELRIVFVTKTPADETLCEVRFADVLDGGSGDWTRTLEILDRYPSSRRKGAPESGLSPETRYYYAAFIERPGPEATAAATATGPHGSTERLYGLLPAVHQQYDEPAPADRGRGHLRRFLQIFGAALDHARSLGEALSARHDVFEARAEDLPRLARWIGWEPDLAAGELVQRHDILIAPEIFAGVGTPQNLAALVTRRTGWKCEVKELAGNVLLTNAPDPLDSWEIWRADHAFGGDGERITMFDPVPVTRARSTGTPSELDWFDGRPAVLFDGAGKRWLFWHSNRSGRRDIWMDRGEGPVRALGDPEGSPWIDESPCVLLDGSLIRLFWSSSREGSWDLWMRTYDISPGAGDVPRRLTHGAGARSPAAARDDSSGRTWLFWESSRRGPTDIWGVSFDASALDANSAPIQARPIRLSTGKPRDRSPAAVVDASGAIHLFWSADLGTESRIYERVFDLAKGWSKPDARTEPVAERRRHEAPSAVMFNGTLFLFFHASDGRTSRLHAMDAGLYPILTGASPHLPLVGGAFPLDLVAAPGDARTQLGAVLGVMTAEEGANPALLFRELARARRVALEAGVPLDQVRRLVSRIVVMRAMGRSQSASDEEPAAVVDPSSRALQLWFRSRRRAERMRSCTVDAYDVEAIERMKAASVDDRGHYLQGGRFGGAKVALYVTVDPGEDAKAIKPKKARLLRFLESFRPATLDEYEVRT
jgi:phage tail-like protein